MTSFTPLPGNAARLQSYGASYGQIAESIADLAARLKGLATDTVSKGESITALADRGGEVATDVSKAQKRYNTTALAIVEFAVALSEAQADANAAISANSDGTSTLGTYRYQYSILEQDRLTMLSAGASQAEIDDINYDIRQLDTKIDNVEHAISQAATKYNNAEYARQQAVKAAIARINPALDALNDGFGDYVRSAWESVGDFLAAIAKWVTDVLGPILLTILKVILFVVIVIVVAAIVVAILTLLGPLGWLLAPFVVMIAAFLVAYVVGEVIKSASQQDPQMDRIGVESGSRPSSNPGEFNQTKDLIENGYLDDKGKENATQIEVIKVVGEDGVVRWRVILPSTQDWEWAQGLPGGGPWDPQGDQGAYNDLGSNAMLMLTPEQEAAYQRAVRKAMLDAGVGPNDPVMMIGWSQGGILAGRFAENTRDEFNVQAIFVAGSPIDGMNIPKTVDVISIQHTGDVVPDLDFWVAPPPNSDHWYTASVPPYNGGSTHAADSYADTADYVLKNADPQLAYISEKQQVFYGGTSSTTYTYKGSE